MWFCNILDGPSAIVTWSDRSTHSRYMNESFCSMPFRIELMTKFRSSQWKITFECYSWSWYEKWNKKISQRLNAAKSKQNILICGNCSLLLLAFDVREHRNRIAKWLQGAFENGWRDDCIFNDFVALSAKQQAFNGPKISSFKFHLHLSHSRYSRDLRFSILKQKIECSHVSIASVSIDF